MREALSSAYAYIIRNADTPDSREKIDRALGVFVDNSNQPTLLRKNESGRLEVTKEGASALDAFMAAHSAKPDIAAPENVIEANTLEGMDEPAESA